MAAKYALNPKPNSILPYSLTGNLLTKPQPLEPASIMCASVKSLEVCGFLAATLDIEVEQEPDAQSGYVRQKLRLRTAVPAVC